MREQPFAMVPLTVLEDKRLSHRQLRVLLALLSFRAKKSDTVWPSREQIAARCGLPVNRISQITTELCQLGWLIKMGAGGRSQTCRYRIQHLETFPASETLPKIARVNESVTVTKTVRVKKSETLPKTVTVTESETLTVLAQKP